LKRAEREREDNAERQAMMDQEAHAAWKRIEELDYNLICPYMDHEDKWKKSIGPDLYK